MIHAGWLREVGMPLGRGTLLRAAMLSLLVTSAPVLAQKHGGTLRTYIRGDPPSAYIDEEATISTVFGFMPVFNNLIFYDQAKPTGTLDTIVPDRARSWSWDASYTRLTFALEPGVKWHDSRPFSASDVKCTFELVAGLKTSEDFRRNSRRVWYDNLRRIVTGGGHEVTFELEAPQPSFLALLASGYAPIYPCHVPQREMRAAASARSAGDRSTMATAEA